jgi:hypothetical protein
MLLDDIIWELRDQNIRGPLIDEVFTHIRLQQLVVWDQTSAGTTLFAPGY